MIKTHVHDNPRNIKRRKSVARYIRLAVSINKISKSFQLEYYKTKKVHELEGVLYTTCLEPEPLLSNESITHENIVLVY